MKLAITNPIHSILIIAIVAIITILLRFIPFLVFNGKKESPKVIAYLSNVLPFAIMAMLVIYCLKDISIIAFPFGLPEIIASVIVILLHLWRKNTLLSISVGTIIYMLLIQFVFI